MTTTESDETSRFVKLSEVEAWDVSLAWIRKVTECRRLAGETCLTLCRSNIKFLPAYLVLSSSSIELIEVKIFSI